jgi:hypothetical protein
MSMKVNSVSVLAAALSFSLGVHTSSASAQTLSSVPMSDVEIQWKSGGGDGCAVASGCSDFHITIHGGGLVELDELPWGPTHPRPEIRRRPIASDQVVKIVNEFLKARFFEAADGYNNVRVVAIQRGDLLTFEMKGGVGGGWVDLTLRLGPTSKIVRLGDNVPADLAAVRDLIWRIAGPQTWSEK